jgi:hypothetical protein
MLPPFVACAGTPAKHNLWVPCPEIPDSGQETRPNDIRIDALAEKIAHYILIGPRTLLFHGRRIFESNTRIIGQMITE